MDSKYEHYSMHIQWSVENEAYIVTTPELPECRAYGTTYEEVVRRGKDAIASWMHANLAQGNPVPPPRLYQSE